MKKLIEKLKELYWKHPELFLFVSGVITGLILTILF
jgi:uncharacterized membrane protein (DUF106 family)